MTILEPNRSRFSINLLPFALALVLIGLAVFSIYLYNQNVGLRHLISQNSRELQSQVVKNSDLKNQYYQVLSAKAVESVAREKGLVREKNPQYLESKPLTLNRQ